MIREVCMSLCACLVLAGPAAAHGKKAHDQKKSFVPANLQMEVTEFGRTGDPGEISRIIEVTMSDEMKFEPSEIRVKTGETIRFIVTNGGGTLHEMVIGTGQDLLKHAALMQRFPDMEHAEPFTAHADEGQEAEIIWTFDKPGMFEFGCLIPGHFEAGMRGTIQVETEPLAVGGSASHGFSGGSSGQPNEHGR